jgi:DUF4097 and DUF4098 domain-containing protein YvlB
MKSLALPILLGVTVSLAGVVSHSIGAAPLGNAAKALDGKKDKRTSGKIERSTEADPHVTLTLCVMSGQITVRGWDKSEVRARSSDAQEIAFRRIDKTKDSSKPATRIDVMITDKSEQDDAKHDCQATADVELDVPMGCTVQVQTRDGDISITGVAAAYAGSQNGDISIERAARLVEAGSVGGSISLKDSSGRINLNSAGGGVSVANTRPVSPDDSLEVGTVSGDIELEGVSNAKVVAKTVNGNVTMMGPLAHGGHYGFTTMSGDVSLELPEDASFQLNAKISENKELVSDFPLKFTADPSTPAPAPKPAPSVVPVPAAPTPKAKPPQKSGPMERPVIVKPNVVVVPYPLRRIYAVCGSGDAIIYVASFGGTLRLQKQ